MRFRKPLAVAAAMATLLAAPAPLAAQPPLLAAVQAIAVTPAFLLGRWTDDGDCTNTVEFRSDGSFVTSSGATGRWSLAGGRLTFQGTSTITAAIRADSATHIILTHDDGSVGESTRCTAAPNARRVAMPAMPPTAQAAIAMSRPIARQLLIGTWTDNGDCSNTVTFSPNGRFVVPTGGGTWTLVGERLTFIGSSTVGARVRAVGQNRILLIHDNGDLGQSVRC